MRTATSGCRGGPSGPPNRVTKVVSNGSPSLLAHALLGQFDPDRDSRLFGRARGRAGVIFVDLALAQIAALGATVGVLMGVDPHGSASNWISLGFTFLGAGLFSVARMRRACGLPQEAFIGIAYAVASAAAILAMSKPTHEAEHLKDMLVGNILAVSGGEVGRTALLYGAIGLFH
jgi:hypothetical protein